MAEGQRGEQLAPPSPPVAPVLLDIMGQFKEESVKGSYRTWRGVYAWVNHELHALIIQDPVTNMVTTIPIDNLAYYTEHPTKEADQS